MLIKMLMRCRWWLLLFALLGLVSCDRGETPEVATDNPVGIGAPAPDFTLTDLQGHQVSLSQLRGKVVLVNFWATWCPPCCEEMPSMELLHQRFKDQGLVLLAINAEEEGAETVRPFVDKHHYSFPILLDTEAEVQNLYQVFRFPETYIIDRNGVIVEKIIGARNWLGDPLVKRLNFLLNG